MCTADEVKKIVAESECRQQDKLEKSHIAIAGTISNFGADVKELRVLVEEHIKRTEGDTDMRDIMKDVADSYRAFIQLGKMTKWLASVALSLGALYIFFGHIIKYFATTK